MQAQVSTFFGIFDNFWQFMMSFANFVLFESSEIWFEEFMIFHDFWNFFLSVLTIFDDF